MKNLRQNLNRIVLPGFVTLIWVVSCIVILIGFDGELSLVSSMMFGLYLYASFMLWKTVMDNRVRPLALMFWLFHTHFLFLPALSQTLQHQFFWSDYRAYPEEMMVYACVIIMAGLLAFNVGSYCAGRRRYNPGEQGLAARSFLAQPLRATWQTQLFCLGILMYLVMIIYIWGPGFFMISRVLRVGQLDNQAALGLILNLPRAFAVSILLFSLYLLAQKWHQTGRIQFPMLVIFCAAIGVNAVINYPLGLSRFWFFGAMLSIVWAVFPLRSIKSRSIFIITVTLLQFTIFPWFSQVTRGSGLLGFDLESIRRYLHFGDFDGFQSTVHILILARDTGFDFGRNLLSSILFFIPRSLWDKAEPLGEAAAEHMGYPFTNLSAPIYGEFYMDFGLLSLIAGMGMVGYVSRIYDGYYHYMVRNKRYGAGMLLASVLAGYLIILLRGSLLGVISSIATLFGSLVIACWLATFSSKRRSSGSSLAFVVDVPGKMTKHTGSVKMR